MTPAERELALRKKAEKRLRKGMQVEVQEEPIQEVIIDNSEPLPEAPKRKKIIDVVNITHADGEVTAVIYTDDKPLPEEPAIRPRRRKNQAA